MRLIARDGVVWSVCVCLCVCLFVTSVNPAKTREPVEMPFRGLTHMGQNNHVLDVLLSLPVARDPWTVDADLSSILYLSHTVSYH